jgi:predicted oxidoreductase
MIHVCLENKITTFDHADIYGSYTTEGAFGKAFASGKIAEKKTAIQMWDQMLAENRDNKIITTTLSHTLSGLLNNR